MKRTARPQSFRQINHLTVVGLLATALALAACEKPSDQVELPDQLSLTAVGFEAVPGWSEDRLAEALPALRRSCRRLLAQPDARPLGPNGLAGSIADWRRPCGRLLDVAAGDEAGLRDALEGEFVAFRADNQNGRPGLFTGYFEPELRGALKPDGGYRWPLYRLPDDLVTADPSEFEAGVKSMKLVGRVEDGKLLPYHARAEIDGGVLDRRGLELVWVDDPVDAFFLHVQGSGRVRLPDGGVLRVGFAGSNGRPFYAIGRALIDEGKIDRSKASMQSIRDWLRANPKDAQAVMNRNERYIFFREIDGEGPVGAQGVALTPGRSLAVDRAFMPLGAPVWLDTTWPGTDRALRRLMVAQDTGGAIKGPVRGDFFWGSGEAALEQAGRMKQKGSYYLFLPRAVAKRHGKTS